MKPYRTLLIGFGLVILCYALAGDLPTVAQARRTTSRFAAPGGDAVVEPPCTEAEFDNALNFVIQAGGGTITFNCGDVGTILFSGEKVIGLGITVDGARPDGRMRLSGHGARLFGVTVDGSLTLRNLALTDGNAGADDGGAVINYGALAITNSEISGNSGQFVGGVENWGATTLTNVDIHDNGSVGLSHHGGREAILTNVTVRSNGANGSSGLFNDTGAYLQMTGGAIQSNGNYGLNNAGTAVLADVTVSGNPQSGVWNNGTLTLARSTLNGNGVSGLHNNGVATLTNVTISGNSGSGVDNVAASVTLRHVTIHGNTENGIRNTGDASLIDTILNANSSGNCAGNVTSQGYNLSSDGACALTQASDLTGVDPQLGPLGDNGGPTQTHLPGPGSSALDGGACLPDVATDQRGVVRPQGGACDIGAVEVVQAPPEATPTATATATPSHTPTRTLSPTATPTRTSTPTASMTATPTRTAISSPQLGTPTVTTTPTRTLTPSTVTSTPTATSTAGTRPYRPAPIAGGQQPSIMVNPSHGYAGQVVTVSGQAVAETSGVRIAWVVEGTTILAAQAARNAANNTYAAQVTVLETLDPGPAQVCVVAVGAARPAFACADFTVDMAPAGEIAGRLAAAALPGQAGTAAFQLLDEAGREITRAPIAADGRFQLQNVPPGVYNYAVGGLLGMPVDGGSVSVGASRLTQLDLQERRFLGFFDPVTGQDCAQQRVQIASAAAVYSDHGWYAAPAAASAAAPAAGQPGYNYLHTRRLTLSAREDFGTYITGISVPNTFSVQLQQLDGGAIIDRVEYHILRKDNGQLIELPRAWTAPDYATTFDVGRLPPGRHTLLIAPVVGGVRQCPYRKRITVIPSPAAISRAVAQVAAGPLNGPAAGDNGAAASGLNAGPCDGELRKPPGWTPRDALDRTKPQPYYHFSCIMPKAGSGLPVQWPETGDPLPILGNIQSQADASFTLVGRLDFAGYGAIEQLEPYIYARLLGDEQCNYRRNWVAGHPFVVDPLRPGLANFDLPLERLCTPSFHRDFGAPVWISFENKTVARVNVFMDLDGRIDFGMNVRPFAPHADLQLLADANVSLGASFKVEFLVLGAGAELRTDSNSHLDAQVNTDWPTPYLIDACTKLFLRLQPFVDVGVKFWGIDATKRFKLDPIDVANYQRCLKLPSAYSQVAPSAEPAYPRVMAAPALAAAADGRMLSVYVEDTAPGAADPAPQVRARLWSPASQNWSAPMPVSGSARGVNDPVVAFFGPNDGRALAAWTQTEMSAAEEEAATSLDDFLRRLEIYAALWDGAGWGAPVRLTDDLVADGRAAIAGDANGISLAWTRNAADGVSGDYRVALREYDAATSSWGPLTLLGGGAGVTAVAAADASTTQASGLNYAVSLDRRWYPAADSSRTVVTWVYDADGDLATGGDRRIAMAGRTSSHGNPGDWVGLDPQPLPPRVAQPSIRLSASDPAAVRLAFLADSADANTPDALASFGQVWTADIRTDGATSQAVAAMLTDQDGAPVTGERPALTLGREDEALVTFQRFGGSAAGIGLGELATSRGIIFVGGRTQYAAPVALTDPAAGQLWQAAAAVNPLDNSLRLLAVQRAAVGAAQAASADFLSRPTDLSNNYFPLWPVSDRASSIISFAYPDAADPALDPQLSLARRHAPVGSAVEVTATGRNLGRRATAITVRLFRGIPGAGILAGEVALPAVAFNQPFTATITLTVGDGPQPLFAQAVAAAGGNLDTGNDLATGDLSALPPPAALYAAADAVLRDLVLVTIQPAEAEEVAGYRLWRSTSITGTYDLVAEAAGVQFVDAGLARGQTYCYQVQSYDLAGLVSPLTQPVCARTEPVQIYLPLVRR
jgi:hypothetical protein